MIRLDKYLADIGVGTRTEVKQIIRQGKIKVNGILVNKPDIKLNAETDIVEHDNQKLLYEQFEYYMLHKPAGYVSATTDAREKTVMDLITGSKRKDLFPVGRLDKDTEGLLLITNDGALAHRLLSPKNHINKLYYAKVEGVVTQEDQQIFAAGLSIGPNEITMPANLQILTSAPISEIFLTIQEGKFHQVKRMFEAVGKKVLYLKRLSMADLKLDEQLKPGEYRALTKEELQQLC